MIRFFKPLADAGRKIVAEVPVLCAGVSVGYATRKLVLAAFKQAQPYIAPDLKDKEPITDTPRPK